MRMLARSQEQYDIAMTPLIDMMFLLIIFFLVSTAFIDPEKDQSVRLPEAGRGDMMKRSSAPIVVNILETGLIRVSGRIVTVDDLREKLAGAVKKDPKQIVKIRGDRMTRHQHVVRVLDACKTAKIKNISIVTRLVD